MRSGDRVQLRSPRAILATLDEHGCLEGVPFMPEMLSFFGKPFTVTAQVERACDTVHYTGVVRLRNTVILDELRCDGSGHDGCGAQCRFYWKEAWLRPASGDASVDEDGLDELRHLVTSSTRAADSTPDVPIFRCQATELIRAGEPVGRWSLSSFWHEYTGGNVSLWRFITAMSRIVIEGIGRRVGLASGFPFKPGEMGAKSEVPPQRGLRPGELVQIRSGPEIGRTLNSGGKNRGLWFDLEMKVYCGRQTRVKAKVERFIDEGTGRMIELASDAYILEGVVCESFRSNGRWFCPRAIYPWWREAWLQPLEVAGNESAAREADAQSR
jgi:hypothetical protein